VSGINNKKLDSKNRYPSPFYLGFSPEKQDTNKSTKFSGTAAIKQVSDFLFHFDISRSA